MKMTTQQFCELLKKVVELYTKHPELPLPLNYSQTIDFARWDLTAEQMKAVVKAFPRVRKNYGNDYFSIVKDIFPRDVTKEMKEDDYQVPRVKLTFQCPRERVCERKVVGTKIVPAHEVPAYTVPERVEELVEWECKPILGINGKK